MASSADQVRHPEKVNKPDNPIQRKPAWIRVKAPTSRTMPMATRSAMNICAPTSFNWSAPR